MSCAWRRSRVAGCTSLVVMTDWTSAVILSLNVHSKVRKRGPDLWHMSKWSVLPLMYARHLPTKMAQVTLWTHLDETQNVIHSCIRFLLQLFLCSLFQKYVVLDIFLFYLGSLVSLLPDGTYINYRYQGHQERAPGPVKHFFRVSPARADWLNVFTLNRKNWLSVAE